MSDEDKPSKGKKGKVMRRAPILRRKLAGVTVAIQHCKRGDTVAIVVVRIDGKRREKSFKTIEAAKAYAQKQEIEAQNAGARAASAIGDKERRALLDGAESLEPYGKTLADAVAFYLAHLKANVKSSTVAKMVETFLDHKTREKKSPRHLSDLGSRLSRFSVDFGNRPIGSIEPEEIDKWLAGLNYAPVGYNNSRRVLGNLFNFAAQRGYAPHGILRRTALKKVTTADPIILTVPQADALIRNAHPAIRASVVLGLFCGCREAEIAKMTWEAVKFQDKRVVVSGQVAKVNQRRSIKLQSNALAWLQALKQDDETKIMPTGRAALAHLQKARNAAGFGAPRDCTKENGLKAWPSNALRHSFASYAVARWPNNARLADEMGNSTVILLRHYRSMVSREAAKQFWDIRPDV